VLEDPHATLVNESPVSATSMLDAGNLPVEELAGLAGREGKRPRPVYGAHKWFARRAGSAFRALLVASSLPTDGDFWQAYYGEADLSGVNVLDPFVGGGTSVVEARRLGATVTGVDVDPVACAVTSFETRAEKTSDPLVSLVNLRDSVATALAPFYRTTLPDGEVRDVLHFFWVQVVTCGTCKLEVEAHPHYRLANETQSTHQWVFCSGCHSPKKLPRWQKSFTCRDCQTKTRTEIGTVTRGNLTCPYCKTEERLIDVADRVGAPPKWRLFALESIAPDRPGAGRVSMPGRVFSAATDADRALYDQAVSAFGASTEAAWIEKLNDKISARDRTDDRLIRYGYRRYRELFNDRQLLHLASLGSAIRMLPSDQREAALLAFSDHLTKNCMLTCYAFGWRRLVPLFAVRAFRHIPRPVEVNPWLDGVGRGTYPNALRQVARAVDAAKDPTELLRDGGSVRVPACEAKPATIIKGTAQELPLADDSVDLVLTDPPYFDNIDYSELAEFYRPWVQALRLATTGKAGTSRKASLAARTRNRGSAELFTEELAEALTEIARVLKPGGRLVFTFRHNLARGWHALGDAVVSSGSYRCVQVFPLLAEGTNELHTHSKSGVWDAVFVLEQTTDEPDAMTELDEHGVQLHAEAWADRLKAAEVPVPFGEKDRTNFEEACLVAGRLGCFARDRVSPSR